MAYKLFVNGNTLPASDLNTAFATSGWTAFTPTIASGSLTVGTGGTLTGYYVQVGKTVHYRVRAVFGSSGRALNDPRIAFPVAPSAAYADYSHMGNATYRIASNSYLGNAQYLTGYIRLGAQTTSSGLQALSTTVPGTLGTGDIISFSGFYEAA